MSIKHIQILSEAEGVFKNLCHFIKINALALRSEYDAPPFNFEQELDVTHSFSAFWL